MIKKYLYLLLAVAGMAVCQSIQAQTINENGWVLTMNEEKCLTVVHNGTTIFADAYAQAECSEEGAEALVTKKSTDAESMEYAQEMVVDNFGTGNRHSFTYTFSDGMKMIQTFSFYTGLDYAVAQLMVTRGDGTVVKSNSLRPLASNTTVEFHSEEKTANRMLFVPWDNDGFISYGNHHLRRELHSFNVQSLYNYKTRFGIVLGAVDHNVWKNAIKTNATDYYKVNELALISGYTDEHTHDSILSESRIMPHGAVHADTVKSSRFMLGTYSDWRTGMESFASACNKVAPKREWKGGTPYGWQSWGVMETHISYEGVMDVAAYIKEKLVPMGFHDELGRIVMSLDAWWNDNLNDTQIAQFVQYCEDNNMIPGLYYGSFCLFGWLDNVVPGTSNKYKFKDIALKQNGQYKIVDGAYCLDPTHPGTLLYMQHDINKFKRWGIKYLKCDFMSNGAIEADSWYRKGIYTGTQAYDFGMAFLWKCIGKDAEGNDNIYIDLSISPTFPYQYAHGRRISCDAWGTIDHTAYVMNNTSYGWWLKDLYVANDPDGLVLNGSNQDGSAASGYDTDGINRARLTSGVATGAYLTADNYSYAVQRGNVDRAREQAEKLLTIPEINEIPRTCSTFYPVESSVTDNKQEKQFVYENDKYVYVAVFNYGDFMGYSGTITYDRLGVDASNMGEIKELWLNKDVTLTDGGFKFSVPYRDARIYRISKLVTGIEDITTGDEQKPEFVSYKYYDALGREVNSTAGRGIYIIKGVTADGQTKTFKVCK